VKLTTWFVRILVIAWCLGATDSNAAEPERSAPPGPDIMAGKEPGRVRDDNRLKMKFVWCPPGSFIMGDVDVAREPLKKGDAAEPALKDKSGRQPGATLEISPVKVELTRGYWLGQYEVTQSQWKEMMGSDPWRDEKFTTEGDDIPATHIDWTEAMWFCDKLTEAERAGRRLPEGWEYTLPTEAQWERACRALTQSRFSFGEEESKLEEYAWFYDNAWNTPEKHAHRIGQKKPNPWGLYDMHGNVWEWCRDWYEPSRRPAPADFKLPGGRDPEVTKPGFNRVLRGGGWDFIARDCRSAARDGLGGLNRSWYVGFRVVLSTVPEAGPVKPAAETPDRTDK
jgi:formylglycine-generating enzyme required for sulfatase activity